MRYAILMSVLCGSLGGCAAVTDMADRFGLNQPEEIGAPSDPFVQSDGDDTGTALAPETAAPPPLASAQTADALDTTTAEQRAAAAAPNSAPVQSLGTTVVSLGSPTEPGLWIKTPLVSEAGQGRVTNPATGQSTLVSVLPLPGPKTGGSRMSLPALRLIGASLTDLTEVEVALDG